MKDSYVMLNGRMSLIPHTITRSDTPGSTLIKKTKYTVKKICITQPKNNCIKGNKCIA